MLFHFVGLFPYWFWICTKSPTCNGGSSFSSGCGTFCTKCLLLVVPLFCQLSPAIPIVVWGWVLVGDLWLVFWRVRQQVKFRFAGMVYFGGPWAFWRLCHCLAFQVMGHCFQEECVWLLSRWLPLSRCFEGNKLRRACVRCSIFSIDWYNSQSRMAVLRWYQFLPVHRILQNTLIASLWRCGNLCWSS